MPAGVDAVVAIVRVELPVTPGVNPTRTGFNAAVKPVGGEDRVTFRFTVVVRPRL